MFVTPVGFKPTTYCLACHTMLPQPNKQRVYHFSSLLYGFLHILNMCLGICLLWSGIHLYHIEILARLRLFHKIPPTLIFRRFRINSFSTQISTQVSPIYSLHIYDTFNIGITEANLMLVKFPRTLISQFSTVLSSHIIVQCCGTLPKLIGLKRNFPTSFHFRVKDFHRFREILLWDFSPQHSCLFLHRNI